MFRFLAAAKACIVVSVISQKRKDQADLFHFSGLPALQQAFSSGGKHMKKIIIFIVTVLLLGVGMYFQSRYNFLFFHATIDFITALIGVLIFVLSFSTKNFRKSDFYVQFGPGILTVSLLTFLHAFTYNGTDVIRKFDPNFSLQISLIMNFIQAVAVFVSILHNPKKVRYLLSISCYFTFSAVMVTLCFLDIFPVCYIPGIGQTHFKMFFEAVILVLYALGAIFLAKNKTRLPQKIYAYTLAVVLLFGVSEFLLTFYINLSGMMNFIGHYLRAVAFCIIYITLVVEGIQKPYGSIFMELRQLSVTDSLTGLLNNRSFIETLQALKSQADKTQKGLYLIIFDIDNFKMINDTFGHLTGDQVLVEVSETIKKCIRKTDYAARQGGDEFAIILYDAGDETVSAVISRIKFLLKNSGFTAHKIHVTISCGVVRYCGGSIHDLIHKTDAGMYKAKSEGKDSVHYDSLCSG